MNQDAGMSALDNAMSVLNMTLHKWFNTNGTLGVSDGTDKIAETRKTEVEAVLKGMMGRLESLKDDVIVGSGTLSQEDTIPEKQMTRKKRSKKTSRTDTITEMSKSSKVMESLTEAMCPCKEILTAILTEIQSITKNGININDRKPGQTNTKEQLQSAPEEVRKETPTMGPLQRSLATISAMNPFKTSKAQDDLMAESIKKYGLTDGDKAASSGDKVRIARRLSLFRGADKFSEMFKDFKITPGVNIDTTEITKEMAKTLSGPAMFNAQSGGWKNNLAIAATGGIASIWQPSLEKSRALADAVNTMMANMREAMNTILQDILAKESALSAMQERGDVTFNEDGSIASGTNEAWALATALEQSKAQLSSIMIDADTTNKIAERTKGNLTEMVKQLRFTSPILRENNAILANVNAGYDKNGKALKFQKRSQELLNYSFQRMSRQLGQMLSRWMLMLNPITQIRKAFRDFASYDTKWQRTMNVIKYNIRRIIQPFMEWLAQQFVNLIGLANALIKGIGRAFDKDWDLFDQSAANAEKMREELEQAANVTAGFDELHDIGSDNTAAGDLMGDIYTPQWDGLNEVLENIGKTIGNIINAVSNWTFWDWLILAGAALAGFIALKALINWFKGGTNPLQTVASGFSFLEKAVGWAILIASFALFTKVLTDFVECMKTAEWEDIGKSLAMLGGALLELGSIMVALMGLAKLFGTTFLQSFGVATIVAAFALLIASLSYFIDTVSKIQNAGEILQGLAGILLVVAGVIVVLLAVLTALISTGLGALAVLALAAILAAIALVIVAMADFVRAVGENAEAVKMFMEELRETMRTWGEVIVSIITAIGSAISGIIETIAAGIETIGNVIIRIVEAVANSITIILQPILDFIDGVIGKIIELATTVAHEIGETIRTIIKTTGDVIIGIIDAIVGAIPRLLASILNFCREIGPAIENSVDAILRSITKLINFIVSGIEYLVNTLLIGSINKAISTITFGTVSNLIERVDIPRFVPQYEQGTNYVPNNGLAYLHQGEAVVPKKYNQPYNNGLSNEERTYMQQMMNTMRSLDNTMRQGIVVNGEFRQRGSDLVAIVNKTKSQTGSDLLSNVSYAR